MRKLILVIIIVELTFILGNSFLQKQDWSVQKSLPPDTSVAKYVPMTVGNLFTFICSTSTGNSYSVLHVTKDTVAYGHRYFYYQGVPAIGDGYTRYDSSTGLLLQYYPGAGAEAMLMTK